jgi:glycosyltransferase involved in cell wall biosynthesis
MKIAYFNYHYDVRGTARGCAVQIEAVAQGLRSQGHQVDLHYLAAHEQGESRIPASLKKRYRLRRYGHVPRLILRNYSLARKEYNILRSSQADVVLAVSSLCNFSALLSAHLCRIPFVLFCDGPLEYEYSMFYPQYYPYPWVSRGLEGFNVRSAHRVICISEVLKGFMMRYGAPASNIHVVPNGVDIQAFEPSLPDPELRERFNLDQRLVIGYVGSFQFLADLKEFVSMAVKVCEAHPQVVFLFVGQGELDEQMRLAFIASNLGERVIFTGAIPHQEVPRYLSTMDVTLCPYRSDYLFYGSSMKLLEYMAAGKVVVTSPLGQIKELVLEGYNGMFYDPDDLATLGPKLSSLIDAPDLRQLLGSNARRTIEQGWTWDLQAVRLAKILQMAIDGR